MANHTSRSWTIGLIRGKLSPRRRRTVLAHLLAGCDPCRQAIAPVAGVMFRPGRAIEPVEGGAEYDGPVHRAISLSIHRNQELTREREKANRTDLSRLPDATLRACEGRTWGLCEVLLSRSWDSRHDNAREMLRLASLAHEAADRLDPDFYGREHTFDMRALAWGEYGNACRVNDDLVLAEWAFRRALEMRNQGSGSSSLRARLAELTAGLLSHQRQFQPALRALDAAYVLYRRLSLHQDAIRVQISRGIYTGRSGDPEMGLLILAKVLISSNTGKDKIEDPKLSFIALHNILLFRVEQGEFREANHQLFKMRPLYARHAGSVDALKLRWIEARISAGLGKEERAERDFLHVWEGFNRRGQVYHAAVVGLDLAAMWLRRGRLADVKRMVGEILEVFRARHVAREAIAALLMLRNALDQDRVSLALITGVASLIALHQGDSLDSTNGVQP